MNGKEIEEKVKNAFEFSVPDISDRIMNDLPERKGEVMMEKDKSEGVKVADIGNRRKAMRRIVSVAAVLLLIVTGIAGYAVYDRNMRSVNTVSLDVNPSVEIEVNRKEKVLTVTPKNEDGKKIIGSMDFRGSSLEVTVNALLGSMLKNGYLSELSNSILLTVKGKDAETLRQKLSSEINSYLKEGDFLPAVLSVTDEEKEDDGFSEIAETYGISRGKARLIAAVHDEDQKHSLEELSKMTVNELNLLLGRKEQKSPAGINSSGEASSKAYMAAEEAEEIALAHAGADRESVKFDGPSELDFEDGVMCYEVEFTYEGYEYDYEIDAITGKVLKHEKQKLEKDDDDDEKIPANTEDKAIGVSKAKAIALRDSGVGEDEALFEKAVLEKEDGKIIYEIEFISDGIEYEYEIDAFSGKILKKDKEKEDKPSGTVKSDKDDDDDDDDDDVKEPEKSESYIGASKAKSIALSNAGIKAKDAKELKCTLDKEDGIYEVEFKYNGYEYEYDIDAVTGKILMTEKEKDDN